MIGERSYVKADMRQNRAPRMPALKALLILCAAFVLATMAGEGIASATGREMPVVVFALLQGVFASILAGLLRMAWWWRWIVCLFPIAALGVHQMALPPGIFLGVFLFLLLLFWTTFRSQVPFYPSGKPVWDAVAELLPQDQPFALMDIGSGLGGAVLNWAARFEQATCTGIEVAPLPWLVSVVRSTLSRSRGKFVRGDYTKLNFAHYDVVFAYLSPAAMTALWKKASLEMQSGALLLSYEFMIEGTQPDFIVEIHENGDCLYGWYM